MQSKLTDFFGRETTADVLLSILNYLADIGKLHRGLPYIDIAEWLRRVNIELRRRGYKTIQLKKAVDLLAEIKKKYPDKIVLAELPKSNFFYLL